MSKSAAYDRDSLKTRKRRIEIVSIPDDGTYALQALTVAEIDLWQERIDAENKARPRGNFSVAVLLALCLVDEKTREPIFSVDDVDGVKAAIPYTSADGLWKAAIKLNGLELRTPAEDGSALKNSDATPA